jgi:hypothetical protein
MLISELIVKHGGTYKVKWKKNEVTYSSTPLQQSNYHTIF